MFPTTSIFAVFTFSFITGLVAVLSPGPVSTAIVSQSPRTGWLVGPLVATGHSLLELVLVLLLGLGLGAGLANDNIRTTIALLGGLLLVWTGLIMALNIWRGKIHLPGKASSANPMNYGQLISLGAAATIVNPFWYAWWVTIAAGYLAQARALGIAAIASFYLGHITADYAWDTVLSTVVGGGRHWMTDGLYRGLILLSGGFFIYLGVSFMVQGISRLI